MGQWQQVNKVETNQNASHNFADAVEILLNKPLVVNKRLCGKNVLYREKHPSLRALSYQKLKHVIEITKTHWKRFDVKRVESFVDEIFSQLEGELGSDPKKQKVTDAHSAGMFLLLSLISNHNLARPTSCVALNRINKIYVVDTDYVNFQQKP